ncbi:MAG: 30S ribosomal protein S2 [Candidatus Nanoperiomorbaceae bacterium]
MAESAVDIKQLFEAGAHFGHKTSRWNPKMREYIYGKAGEIHLIDLAKTADAIESAQKFLSGVAQSGKQILFVGTKKQAQSIAKIAAEATNNPCVINRWVGGMLTNTTTVLSQIKKLKGLEKRMDSGELANRYNKLEVQRYQEEIDSLEFKYGGIKDIHGKLGAVIILSAADDHLAVQEAGKLGIPTVAIIDTNADPTEVKYPIPANDDAISALQLITDYLVEAIRQGQAKIVKEAETKGEK